MSEVVVITGCSSGIGEALAKHYLSSEAKVVGMDVTLPSQELKFSSSFHFIKTDVSKEDQIRSAAKEISEIFGVPTHWYNNAGIVVLNRFEKVSSEDFNRVMDVNFNGVVYGTRAALELVGMKEVTIVNMASVAGTVPCSHMSSYVAAKHAVVGFTRALRVEHALLGSLVKFVLVSPGFVKTKITEPQNGIGIPESFQFLIDDPHRVARQIINAVRKGKQEIAPTWNGKLALSAYRVSPKATAKSARLLTASHWKEVLGFRPIQK